MNLIVEENMRLQLEHPQINLFVRNAMQDGAISLQGRVYDMSNGGIKDVQRNNLACRE